MKKMFYKQEPLLNLFHIIEGNVDNSTYMFRLSVCELLVLKLSIKLG